MEVFIQGMRRSGTTFLFDILREDGSFRGFYEPLSASHTRKASLGGGSKITEIDYNGQLRAERKRFLDPLGEQDVSLLNWGAPTDPMREIGPELPELVVDYLTHLCSRADDVALKFCRAYDKLDALDEVFPQAKLLHIVRDPRAVVTSFLFGKRRKRADLYKEPEDFFENRRLSLQAVKVADALIERALIPISADETVPVKLMATWAYHFRQTTAGAESAFPDRHVTLRHESILEDPDGALDRIYGLLGRPVPDHVRQWMRETVLRKVVIHEPENPRWGDLVSRAGIRETLVEAGYGTSGA